MVVAIVYLISRKEYTVVELLMKHRRKNNIEDEHLFFKTSQLIELIDI